MTSETAAPQNQPQIRFTEAAAAKLKEVIAGYPRPVAGLRLQIVGRGPEGLQHVLSIVEGLPVPVFVEGQNLPYLQDVTVNYRYKGPNISGLEFENPSPVWLDPLALRVQQVFDTQINPAIAAHGGFVQLLDVKDGVAYVQLGGGCQGCGMADVTLKQGIAVAVKEAVPEIREVVDSTDHASGTNPYFRPSKK
jgi:Fe-S cluster biogenesis protein NfuA/Fe-S cluster assembly iron-binding protein IscA